MDRVVRTTFVAYLALLLGVAAFGAAPARADSDYCIIGYERGGLNLSIQVFACSYGPDDPDFSLTIELSGPGYPTGQTVYSGGGYGGVEHDFAIKLPNVTGVYVISFIEKLSNAPTAAADFSFALSAADVGAASTPQPTPTSMVTPTPTTAKAVMPKSTAIIAATPKSKPASPATPLPMAAPVATSTPALQPTTTGSTLAPSPSSIASPTSIPSDLSTPVALASTPTSLQPADGEVPWAALLSVAAVPDLGLLWTLTRRRRRNKP